MTLIKSQWMTYFQPNDPPSLMAPWAVGKPSTGAAAAPSLAQQLASVPIWLRLSSTLMIQYKSFPSFLLSFNLDLHTQQQSLLNEYSFWRLSTWIGHGFIQTERLPGCFSLLEFLLLFRRERHRQSPERQLSQTLITYSSTTVIHISHLRDLRLISFWPFLF